MPSSTAMTIAANEDAFGEDLARALSGDNFRAYTTDDIIGMVVKLVAVV